MDTALSLGAAFVIGLFIFYVYQKTYSGVLYSRSFNVSLVAILLVTTLVISGVTSNVVLSLGMVGALSIVRFRTAVGRTRWIGVFVLGDCGGDSLRRKLLPLALLAVPFWAFSCFFLQTISRRITLSDYCAPDGGVAEENGGQAISGAR